MNETVIDVNVTVHEQPKKNESNLPDELDHIPAIQQNTEDPDKHNCQQKHSYSYLQPQAQDKSKVK